MWDGLGFDLIKLDYGVSTEQEAIAEAKKWIDDFLSDEVLVKKIMFNLLNRLFPSARQTTYRLRITDPPGNQTYTRIVADNGFDATDKVSAQLHPLKPKETRNIKCLDCPPAASNKQLRQ